MPDPGANKAFQPFPEVLADIGMNAVFAHAHTIFPVRLPTKRPVLPKFSGRLPIKGQTKNRIYGSRDNPSSSDAYYADPYIPPHIHPLYRTLPAHIRG